MARTGYQRFYTLCRDGLTVKDITARVMGEGEPAAMGSGECNPCFEESAGLLFCTGSHKQVLPFPATGVPVLLLVTNGVAQWVNHGSYLNTVPNNPNGPLESAPPPRENGGPGEQTDM